MSGTYTRIAMNGDMHIAFYAPGKPFQRLEAVYQLRKGGRRMDRLHKDGFIERFS